MTKLSQSGFLRKSLILIVILFIIFGFGNTLFISHTSAVSAEPEVQSAIEGFCITDSQNSKTANAVVDTERCDDSPSQAFTVNGNTISIDNNYCLGVENSGTSVGDPVVLNPCSDIPGQNWAVDLGGYQNPNSGDCLTVPHSQTEVQLTITSCQNLDQPNQGWSATHYSEVSISSNSCSQGTEGQRVACNAEVQWSLWQANPNSHNQLLNEYTDGNSYEEWCADFVSYVYKISGYPLQNGERDNWDEYNANNLVNLNFTMHDASSYVPKPGDIAYFDYAGGHVELVVIGGKHPTFIYGDSGTADPITNNGEMNEDMLTNDGSAGGIQYYLSPN